MQLQGSPKLLFAVLLGVSACGALESPGSHAGALGEVPISQSWPEAAWNGHDHLVAWNEQRVDQAGVYRGSVRATRVSPKGRVLDPDGLLIGQDVVLGNVACGPRGCLIISINDQSNRTFGRVIDRHGGIGQPIDMGIAGHAHAASVRGGYLLVWRDLIGPTDTVVLTQVDASGAMGAVQHRITSPGFNPGHITLACDPRGCLALWTSNAKQIYGARTALDGTPIDNPGRLYHTPAGNRTIQYMEIVFNGTSYQLVFENAHPGTPGRVDGMRIDRTGQVLDPVPRTYATRAGGYVIKPCLAVFSDQVLLSVLGTSQTTVLALDRDGVPQAPGGFTLPFYGPNGLSVDRRNVLVLGTQTTSPEQVRIFGARVDSSGTALDTPFQLTSY